MNVFSSVRTWVREAASLDGPFTAPAPFTDLIKKGAERTFASAPRPALSITLAMVMALHTHCCHMGHPLGSVLDGLMQHALMQQSNLLSPAIWWQDIIPAFALAGPGPTWLCTLPCPGVIPCL